ncbi:EGF [Parelaphostrongylus tenuis]|uniref:EGF n=1 Tax=Parelaphostrongylus tenuis TaxID=148309 RepID=A0AAD5MHW3_PARTN|nr:EGF [Parelaphostrongylus tenuis]
MYWDIDEVTYQLRSINCHCPHGYWGRRCELHFVARLFAPVKGHVEVEKSRISALAFIILMVIVTIGLIFYTYRKIVRRNAPFESTTVLSLNHHLRRRTMSFQTMPTEVNTTPSSSAAYLNRYTTSQYFNCRTPFSPLSRSYGQLTGNSHQSVYNLHSIT